MKIACLFHSLVNEIQECAALTGADPRIASVMRRIRPFYRVMFVVLMLATYIPDLSLRLPRLVLRQPRRRFHLVASPPRVGHLTSRNLH